jgi:hypothetical protein
VNSNKNARAHSPAGEKIPTKPWIYLFCWILPDAFVTEGMAKGTHEAHTETAAEN